MANRIKDILKGEQFFAIREEIDMITGETSLINDLALDSIQILELIVGLEQEFAFICEPHELNLDIFDRFDTLIEFVQRKIAGI